MKNVDLKTRGELRERVKELTCLYQVVRLAAARQYDSIDTVLQGIALLLPPAWQYPENAAGRIVLDDNEYLTDGYKKTRFCQSSDVFVNGEKRGLIEVAYLEDRPAAHEGPFLIEERSLIDALAVEVGVIVERHQANRERTKLEDQIRHADRLATIGQLAAGVAHELNEPLASILGFAELVIGDDELPERIAKDLKNIVDASMHAREIVKKLRLFARELPASREKTNLNTIIKDDLYFIESRCEKQAIEIRRELEGNLPEIVADSGQLHQVLTNLTVNSIQAMPKGGVLVISTRSTENEVILAVQDNGFGMSQKVKNKMFLPFFTTKDVDQGTGLGLSVVDGIVSTHGGEISVVSEEGVGTTLEIKLPIGKGENNDVSDRTKL